VAIPPAPPSPTKGWKSEVVEFVWDAGPSPAYHAFKLLGTIGSDVFPAWSDAKIQGVRLCVTVPVEIERIQWAASAVNALSAGAKTVEQVSSVAGWVGSHEPSVNQKWFTVKLAGLDLLKRANQENPNLAVVISSTWVAEDATPRVRFKLVVTVLRPSAAVATHAL